MMILKYFIFMSTLNLPCRRNQMYIELLDMHEKSATFQPILLICYHHRQSRFPITMHVCSNSKAWEAGGWGREPPAKIVGGGVCFCPPLSEDKKPTFVSFVKYQKFAVIYL